MIQINSVPHLNRPVDISDIESFTDQLIPASGWLWWSFESCQVCLNFQPHNLVNAYFKRTPIRCQRSPQTTTDAPLCSMEMLPRMLPRLVNFVHTNHGGAVELCHFYVQESLGCGLLLVNPFLAHWQPVWNVAFCSYTP